VFSFRRPSAEYIRRFLAAQSGLGFTYADVGATQRQPPAGYVVDHTRVKLGHGEDVFKRAAEGLRRWEQFRLGWLSASPDDTPIESGQCVAVVARALGLWCLNAARIVYVVAEPRRFGFASPKVAGTLRVPWRLRHAERAYYINEPRRFGFAYRTLPGHVESGEERFLVDLADDGSVWYDILAFSRPNHFLTRLGYPYVRRLQKRFGRDSAAAMVRVAQTG
jgi:uncharacterized protein (UPF0548 family)